MIRLILVASTVILYLVITLPILLVLWLIGLKNQHARDVGTRTLIRGVFRLILFFAGTKVTVIGQERIPRDQAVLYIGNHRSYFDILLTYTTVPGPAGYIAKIELCRFPIFPIWMKYIHCLFLDRKDIKQGLRTILAGADEIRNGTSMFIFPEGTRNREDSDDQLLEFHNGSFKIATKTNCPIVPVAIRNSASIFEAHLPWIRKTHVVLEYGEPFLPSELTREEKREIGAYTQKRILTMLKTNEKLV